MKKSFSTMPSKMKSKENFFNLVGCSWMDFITAIPSPVFVITSYKANGTPNACLQSWATFTGEGENMYCIIANVNKNGHMYHSVKETGDMVINLPHADLWDKCYKTTRNNKIDVDEITQAGFTVEKAALVNAPLIQECFLNLECKYHWEKELADYGRYVAMCVKVVNIQIDSSLFADGESGRYGDDGYIYYIHRPINPTTGTGRHDSIAVLKKLTDVYTY